jgi:hypothetical protein
VTFFSATDRYLARLIFLPLVGSLVIAAMLLVLDRMLRLFDFVASEGGPVSVVWRMLANLLPEYLSLGIPIGLMPGVWRFRRNSMCCRRSGRATTACCSSRTSTPSCWRR